MCTLEAVHAKCCNRQGKSIYGLDIKCKKAIMQIWWELFWIFSLSPFSRHLFFPCGNPPVRSSEWRGSSFSLWLLSLRARHKSLWRHMSELSTRHLCDSSICVSCVIIQLSSNYMCECTYFSCTSVSCDLGNVCIWEEAERYCKWLLFNAGSSRSQE